MAVEVVKHSVFDKLGIIESILANGENHVNLEEVKEEINKIDTEILELHKELTRLTEIGKDEKINEIGSLVETIAGKLFKISERLY